VDFVVAPQGKGLGLTASVAASGLFLANAALMLIC
jgi:hypothetical protein